MTVIAVVQARRRARRLQGPDGDPPGRAGVEAWLVAEVRSLALPFDAERSAAIAPAAVLVAGAGLYGVAGAFGLGALVVVAGATAIVLRHGAPRRRATASERALPVVLDGVARHLRAGGSLAQAIAATEPPPGAGDLSTSWVRLGGLVPLVGVTAALDDWTAVAPSRAVRLAGAALALAATTGGSPARAVDGVAATLRSRIAVADETRALSSQARASAAVIAVAPIFFAAVAGLSDHRTRDVLASPSGLVLLALGLGLDGLGAAWIARLCRPPAP